MTLDSNLLDLMPSTIKIAPKAIINGYGTKTYGADVLWQCKITDKSTLLKDSKGTEIVSQAMITIAGINGTTVDSRVTMPNGSTPRILHVETHYDEFGALFERIFLE